MKKWNAGDTLFRFITASFLGSGFLIFFIIILGVTLKQKFPLTPQSNPDKLDIHTLIRNKICSNIDYFVREDHRYPLYPKLKDCGEFFMVSIGTGYTSTSFLFNSNGKEITTDTLDGSCKGRGCENVDYSLCKDVDACAGIALDCDKAGKLYCAYKYDGKFYSCTQENVDQCNYINANRLSNLTVGVCSKIATTEHTTELRTTCYTELAEMQRDDSICLNIEPYRDYWGELSNRSREQCINQVVEKIVDETPNGEECLPLTKEGRDICSKRMGEKISRNIEKNVECLNLAQPIRDDCLFSYSQRDGQDEDTIVAACELIEDADKKEKCLPIFFTLDKKEYVLGDTIKASIFNTKEHTSVSFTSLSYSTMSPLNLEYKEKGSVEWERKNLVVYNDLEKRNSLSNPRPVIPPGQKSEYSFDTYNIIDFFPGDYVLSFHRKGDPAELGVRRSRIYTEENVLQAIEFTIN